MKRLFGVLGDAGAFVKAVIVLILAIPFWKSLKEQQRDAGTWDN